MWSLMGREVAEATKPDDFYKASTRETGGDLERHQGARKIRMRARERPYGSRGLRYRHLVPGYSRTAERIVAIRDCGAECGRRGIWVAGALGDFNGAERSLPVEIGKCGVRRGFDGA